MMVKQRLTPGDVLELIKQGRRAYAQYLGRHPEYGDGILVSPVIHESRPEFGPELIRGGYVTFYPASAAVSRGFAEVIGTLPTTGLPTRFRRRGAIGTDGEVLTWIIEDGSYDTVRDSLANDERKLPIAEILNHEMLFHRVSHNWRPENEG